MMRFVQSLAAVFAAVVALAVMAAPGQAHARWLRAESTHFVIYSDGDEASLRDYVRRLEVYDAVMRRATGVPADRATLRKLPIYLVGGVSSMREVWPGMPDGVGGFYSASIEAIHAIGIRSRRQDYILFHEYAHHFMFQHFPAAFPAWYIEGFAEYYMTTEIDGASITIGAPNDARGSFVRSEQWINYRDILSRSSRAVSSSAHDGVQYYAQAWLLTHWLQSDPARAQQLRAYLEAVGRGEDSVAAMEQATGMSIEQLQRTLRAYAGGSFPIIRAESMMEVSDVEIEVLPAVYDDLLLSSLALTRGLDADDRQTVLRRVREGAARHPGDPFARLTLGHAELHFGDRATGVSVLEQLVADHPADLEGLIYLAVARHEAAREAADPAERARLLGASNAYLARALEVSPEDYRIYQLLAENRLGQAGYPNDNDIQLRTLAWQRAPQVAGIVLGFGETLMTVGRFEDAVTVLGPLANSAHRGGLADRAQELIGLARQGLPPTPRGDGAD